MQDSIFSLLPPLVAIGVAVWRKNAILALCCGLLLCFIQLNQWHPIDGLVATVLGTADVFSSISNVYIIVFSLTIGAMMQLMNRSGAVQGFINQLATLNWVKSHRQASLLPTVIGTSIFTDTNLSMFTAGMASQQLFDQHKLGRARLAYLIDSTCAPISILFLINGWGAYVLGLLDGYQFSDPVGVLIGTLMYNFYAIIAVMLAYYTAISGKVFGPMRFDNSVVSTKQSELHTEPAKSRVMWLPLLGLLIFTFCLLYISGNGDIRRGSGSFSVFWSITASFVLLIMMLRFYRLLSFSEIAIHSWQGVRQMAPVVIILALSFAFGDAIKALGTGVYVSNFLSAELPLFVVAPSIFLAAALMAFATGTSWATFAILIPIAIPISIETGLPPEFLVAAVLSGGIFGDHSSPISDTTIVASIASGCDHFEHVKTQLPYALFAGGISIVLFALTTVLLS